MIKGDRDLQNKKLAIKKAIAKAKVRGKCPPNMTPQLAPSSAPDHPIYICKQKDKKKAKLMKKIIKKLKQNKIAMKQKILKAQDTKTFRYGK